MTRGLTKIKLYIRAEGSDNTKAKGNEKVGMKKRACKQNKDNFDDKTEKRGGVLDPATPNPD